MSRYNTENIYYKGTNVRIIVPDNPLICNCCTFLWLLSFYSGACPYIAESRLCGNTNCYLRWKDF